MFKDACKCRNSDSCYTSNECLAITSSSNAWYGVGWLQSKDDLKLKITLPQVTLITAMWWQTDYRSEYNAYLIRVSIDLISKFGIIIIEKHR